ncbi:hypothetical protein TNCV_3875931 [Trichonephila clavipes]|uniref:Uncharacterized protein n=1 Tax=Trichonephila clavipes TaxID=2585209 RepID=A0A8X6VS09_TRICX|nr:hypothetical protein TNCV_3875931 [Trichonephila clavipes]
MCRLRRAKHVLTSSLAPVVEHHTREATTNVTNLCTNSQSVRERLHRKHGIYKKKERDREELKKSIDNSIGIERSRSL